jgi:uncharacterized membrane protein
MRIHMKYRILKIIIPIALLLAIVITPIALYVKQFGFGLWENHDDWAKMGDFFGGVLGTILTTISIVFLAVQIREQSKVRANELSNTISLECEHDVRLYTEKVSLVLSEKTVTAILLQTIMNHDALIKENKLEEAKKLIQTYISDNLELSSAWIQVDSSMRKLYELDIRRYLRLRNHVISVMDMGHISFMDSLVSVFSGKEKSSSLFLVEDNKKNKA